MGRNSIRGVEMSHAVTINYEGIAIECKSICEVASSQLCKLDKMLTDLEKGSSSLLGAETNALKDELLQERSKIKKQLDILLSSATQKAELGRITVDSDYMGEHANSNRIVVEARKLSDMVDKLTTTRLLEMQSLLDTLLLDKSIDNFTRLKNQAQGNLTFDKNFADFLTSIDDSVLRGFVYIASLEVNNRHLSFENLLAIGKNLMESVVNGNLKEKRASIVNDIKQDLQKAKIDNKTIDGIVAQDNILDIRKKATKEIIGESVRKETLKIILKTIEKRGFIVNKSQIKINKEKNEVIAVGQKVSGEKAEFRIYLDGKFIYKFDGYEGQACQEDIRPFMQDLEEIYGISIKSSEEIWSNPDKISTMKYQQMNTNKNKK